MRFLFLLIPLLLLAIEGGVQAWRQAEIASSTAPVFYWKEAPLLTTAPPPFGAALQNYRADRGAEKTMTLPEGSKMTLFYLEWDRLEVGPIIALSGHEAEICNVAAGFKLLQSGGRRTYHCANGVTLDFDYTLLESRDGKPVHVYKLPWIQGFGTWRVNSSVDRTVRLRRSFLRHSGAARVIEAGIFGTTSEDDAWRLFQREVLAKLEWVGRKS